jgi:beta-galactosidase
VILERAVKDAGVEAIEYVAPGVEVVRRHAEIRDYVFVLNHTEASVVHSIEGFELITEHDISGEATVAPGGVHIIRQERN